MPDWRWFRRMTLRLRTLFQRNRVEQELEEEFQFHIERRIELEIARGLSPEEARSAALRAMDGVQQRKEECRDMRGVNYIDDLLRDLRYAGRFLTDEEMKRGGGGVMISYAYWQSHFGGDPRALGQNVRVYGSRAIVGVLPPGFRFPDKTDLWFPMLRGGTPESRSGQNYLA